ncbi:MAG: hypothetical protein PUE61_01205 [Clostridiales bacterium]|nr:hypothetical protein [Clostridiales bacterium]
MFTLLGFLLEGVLGYLLQAVSFLIGMHGIARHKISVKKSAIVCLICAVVTYLIRSSGLFTFGVHTMLVLLIINAACIIICKISIRPCILGSILMMIFVLLSEVVNVGILYTLVGADKINTVMNNEIYKAASAIPGNILLLVVSSLIYYFRICKGKKNETSQQHR